MDTPPRTFETRFRVRSYELDGFAHLNHAVFLNWFEQARFEAFDAGGFPAADIQGRGCGVYVVHLEIEYRREAKLGDEIVVWTSVVEVGRSSMVFLQVASPADDPDAVTAQARVRAVWIGTNGKPARVPEDVRVALGG